MNPQIEKIRAAFAANDYDGARRLWDSYAIELEGSIAAGRATAERLREAGDLLEWARISARVLRAKAADQLSTARAARSYSQASPVEAQLVRTRG